MSLVPLHAEGESLAWCLHCHRALLCALLTLIAAGPLSAQELEPRTYSQTPTGVNFIAAGWGHSAGNVLMDPALPIEGLDGSLNLLFLR